MKLLRSFPLSFLFAAFLFNFVVKAQEPSQSASLAEEEEATVDSVKMSRLDSIKDGTEYFPAELEEYADFAANDSILRLAVVLSDIYSKKDMEFTRGLLMGLKEAGLPSNSVSLKIVNGEIPEDSLQYELDLFGPHLIVSTFDKNAPQLLKKYADENHEKLLNVFDAKGDDHLYCPFAYQLLAPSDKFNAAVTKYMFNNFAGSVLVLIGDPDPADPSIRELILNWPEEEIMILSKEDMAEFVLDEETDYLLYPLYTASQDITEVMQQATRLMGATPSAGLKIFGRPNWVAMNDLQSLIANMEVFIPAKVYFNLATDKSKKFIARYNAMYGHAPIRSYPVYSVMGYDTADYFIPKALNELRGLDEAWPDEDMLQSYFNFEKSPVGGYYNKGGIIIHYEPWGTIARELLN